VFVLLLLLLLLLQGPEACTVVYQAIHTAPYALSGPGSWRRVTDVTVLRYKALATDAWKVREG
jgi:hypothetical protein